MNEIDKRIEYLLNKIANMKGVDLSLVERLQPYEDLYNYLSLQVAMRKYEAERKFKEFDFLTKSLNGKEGSAKSRG